MSFSLPSGALSNLSLIHYRVEGAVAALEQLKFYRNGSWVDRIGQRQAYRDATSRAVESLEAIAETLPPGSIAGAQQNPARLVDQFLPLLRDGLDQVRLHQERHFSQMNLVVNGTVFSRAVGVPKWAKEIIDKAPSGTKVRFEHGQFWIRDDRSRKQVSSEGNLSIAHKNETVRLRSGVEWPVAPGDKVLLGREEIKLNLPPLESIRGEILAAKTSGELPARLRSLNNPEIDKIADQIEQRQFANLPDEGGLSLKVQELVLQETFKEIHKCPKFHPLSGLPEEVALQMFRSLAIAVQGASTPEKLIQAVNMSIVPVDDSIVQGMLDVFDRKAGASVINVPEACGLRRRIIEFSKEAAQEMIDRRAAAEFKAEKIAEELKETSAALAAAEQLAAERAAQVKEAERIKGAAEQDREQIRTAASEEKAEFDRRNEELQNELDRARLDLENAEGQRDEEERLKKEAGQRLQEFSDQHNRKIRELWERISWADSGRTSAEQRLEETLEEFRNRESELTAEIEELEAQVRDLEEELKESELALGRVLLVEEADEDDGIVVEVQEEESPFFGNADPRLAKVETRINQERQFTDVDGIQTFQAKMIAGGESGTIGYRFADGSLLSGKTSVEGRAEQQDAIYANWFTLPDGTVVKILVGSDGAGGYGGGEVVSSAFLQGIHARVVEAYRQQRIPTAAELFHEGFCAVRYQKGHPDRNQDPNSKKNAAAGAGTGAVVVIVGNTAMIATAGDAMVVHARETKGRYKAIGYSDVQNNAGASATESHKIITGVHEIDKVKFYMVRGLRPGDRFVFGSDGLWENILGVQYKISGSSVATTNYPPRSFRNPHPTQPLFGPLNLALEATAGEETAAESIHDVAQYNIEGPGRVFDLNGKQIQLPEERDPDNIFAMNYQHGNPTDVDVPSHPIYDNPLETVAFAISKKRALQTQQTNQCVSLGSTSAFVFFDPDTGLWHIHDTGDVSKMAIDGNVLPSKEWSVLQDGSVLHIDHSAFSIYYDRDDALQLVPLDQSRGKFQAPPYAPPLPKICAE